MAAAASATKMITTMAATFGPVKKPAEAFEDATEPVLGVGGLLEFPILGGGGAVYGGGGGAGCMISFP